MSITLAFDVYGTLIDTHGVVAKLEGMIGGTAKHFSRLWREKQLEYSFRRALMQNYQPFSVCTSQALDYTCSFTKTVLSQEQKDELLIAYRTLPPFEDVRDGLTGLKEAGFRVYAFSNGTQEAVETLLAAAGVTDLFHGVVSVDDLRSFKPNPGVYSHFLRKAGACGSSAWLISGNPFDVIGAISAGMKGAWLKRSEDQVLDPWGIEPTVTVTTLRDLKDRVSY